MAKNKYKDIDTTAGILAVIGALNWGLNLINANLVTGLANLLKFNFLATIVYALVGLSGLWILIRLFMGKYMKK